MSLWPIEITALGGTAVSGRQCNPIHRRNLNELTQAKEVFEIYRVPAVVRRKAAAYCVPGRLISDKVCLGYAISSSVGLGCWKTIAPPQQQRPR